MTSLFGFDLGDLSGVGSWLQPIVGAGIGAYKQSQADNAQSSYLDYLRSREDQNYQDSVNNINAYNAQGQAMSAYSAARAAAAARASAARAAAAGQTEANRQAAAKKANKYQQNVYRQILAMYQPYKATADALLPQMQGAYQNSLGLQNSLLGFVQSPEQVAKLNGSVPAWQTGVPLPDSVRIQ